MVVYVFPTFCNNIVALQDTNYIISQVYNYIMIFTHDVGLNVHVTLSHCIGRVQCKNQTWKYVRSSSTFQFQIQIQRYLFQLENK